VTTGPALATELPTGYAAQRERGAEIVALPAVSAIVVEAVRAYGTLHAWAAAQHDARSMRGRGAAYAVLTGEGAWVVRHYRRGGMVARLLADRYLKLGTGRPLTELHASSLARARGVRTPEVVAAIVYGAGPLLYRGDLATRLVPGGQDLADAVLGRGRGAMDERAAAWRAAGELLRDAFAGGVIHADLNMRNILVQSTPDGTVAHLIDLDRAVIGETAAGDAVRRRMLARLHRSRAKLERACGVRVTAAELAAFEDAVRP
jgi:3-deoxy-D-manno-octulosonic acid kinase